ncbi:MAG: cell division protein FtsW [Epulopiscium sp.]|jgi:cell division protein FtsW|nr:cell division protein FtsW [Candidatus Epulonipiscium sp.]
MGRGSQSVRLHTAKRKKKLKPNTYDFTVLFVVLMLVLFGIVMIFSASYYYTMTTKKFGFDMFYFLKRQMVWAGLGIFAMAFMMNFPYQLLKKFAFAAYAVANICLVLVQLVGTRINGQKRWLGITDSLGFQPSEVAKIAVILYLSFYICTHKDCLKDLKGFFKCLIILMIPVALIAISNFSTAIVLTAVGATILFIASPRIWYFVVAAIPVGLAGVVAVSLESVRYRLGRIQIWLDPFSDPTNKGYQIIQSLYAVASGGLFGLGLGQSRQKTFIPEAYNDIIFAIISEELGMVGAGLVILLFAVLIWRGIRVALNAQDMYGCLVASGITAQIAFQSIINIAVVTNTIPNTGQPLPFISYGGTSLVFTMGMMGILLNISKYQKVRDDRVSAKNY